MLRALALLRGHLLGAGASLLGFVKADADGLVTMTSKIGTSRVVDMLSGEQLPRIC
jgi:hydrogenase expression/formation protein HypE